MPQIILLLALMLTGCVHHLPTPDQPQATITGDEPRMRRDCTLLGEFEHAGETASQARTILSMHVRELGATHLVVTSDRAVNTKKSWNDIVRNNTLQSPLYKMVVASGRGYRCGK